MPTPLGLVQIKVGQPGLTDDRRKECWQNRQRCASNPGWRRQGHQEFTVWLRGKMSPQALTSFSDGESQVQLSKFCVKSKGTLKKELIFTEQLPVYLLI